MKITVIGGGASGCITALMMQKKFPHYDITIVESSNIGIIGVGEATSGNFLPMLEQLDIDFSSFMKASNGTIKMGALFSGWNNENIDFWIPIRSADKVYTKYYLELISSAIKNDNTLNYLDETGFFATQNNVPPIISKEKEYPSAIHFDAFLSSKFFKKIAQERNIKIIDDLILDFKVENKIINKIILSNGEMETDFIFDCSGFNRLVIGNFYKEKWVSVNDTLPINQSIVGPKEIDKDIPPYSKMTALDYGWSFEIPTTSRYGVGYNFDNNYISEDDAILEMKSKIDKNWEPVKSLKYDAGYYKNSFIGNCLAIGLSGSFFEPLEASAIMTVISVMKEVSDNFEDYILDKDAFIKRINLYTKNIEEDIVSAIYIHYVTNKTNNDFWKNFSKNNKMPKQIEKFLAIMESEVPNPKLSDFVNKDKSYLNDYFIKIYYGNGLRNDRVIDKYNDILYYKYLNIIKSRSIKWKDHKEILHLISS